MAWFVFLHREPDTCLIITRYYTSRSDVKSWSFPTRISRSRHFLYVIRGQKVFPPSRVKSNRAALCIFPGGGERRALINILKYGLLVCIEMLCVPDGPYIRWRCRYNVFRAYWSSFSLVSTIDLLFRTQCAHSPFNRLFWFYMKYIILFYMCVPRSRQKYAAV